MEMLIVVAIIAVLVAIAIPTFSGALTKAKEAADVANLRAKYAEAVTENLTNGTAFPEDHGLSLNYEDKADWEVDDNTLNVTYEGDYAELSLSTDASDLNASDSDDDDDDNE